jgi:histidine kinase
MKRLVDDLQELSRVEAGAFKLDLNPVSVLDLVEEVKDRLQPQFDEKDIELFTDVQGDIPLVLADRDRIVQVLLNLVGNALQYTPPGGEVTITVLRNEDDVLVVVKDSGIGISPEHISKLFTRFYRVDKSRSRAGGGSGIGLTISKYLIEAHGGRIWAKSPGIGEGSSFTFTLPVDRSKHSKS